MLGCLRARVDQQGVQLSWGRWEHDQLVMVHTSPTLLARALVGSGSPDLRRELKPPSGAQLRWGRNGHVVVERPGTSLQVGLPADHGLLASCVAVNWLTGHSRETVRLWRTPGSRNIPRKKVSPHLAWKEIGKKIAEEVQGMDGHELARLSDAAFAELRKQLGLDRFRFQKASYAIDDAVLDRLKTTGVSADNLKALLRGQPVRFLTEELDDWLPRVVTRPASDEGQVRAVLEKFASSDKHLAMMALEAENEGVRLVVANPEGQSFSFAPEKIVQLIENAGRTRTIIRGRPPSWQDRQSGTAEVIAGIDPEHGRLQVVWGKPGKRIEVRDDYEDQAFFYINIDELLSYYLVFKREISDQTRFLRLREAAWATPAIELFEHPRES